MQLDDLPVFWSQGFDVDRVRNRRVDMYRRGNLLALGEAQSVGQCCIELDHLYLLVAG